MYGGKADSDVSNELWKFDIGTNNLVGISIENLTLAFTKFLQNGLPKKGIPELWDGKASERIIDILLKV